MFKFSLAPPINNKISEKDIGLFPGTFNSHLCLLLISCLGIGRLSVLSQVRCGDRKEELGLNPGQIQLLIVSNWSLGFHGHLIKFMGQKNLFNFKVSELSFRRFFLGQSHTFSQLSFQFFGMAQRSNSSVNVHAPVLGLLTEYQPLQS